MKKIVSLIVMILGLVEIQAQITIDLGRDTTYCSNSIDFTKVSPAKNLKITGDTTGAKFLWEAKGNIGNETYDAADNLSNKTIVSPNFKYAFGNDNKWQKFKLTIEKNGVKHADSVNLRVSSFLYTLGVGTLFISKNDTINLHVGCTGGGIQPYKSFLWSPSEGITNPNIENPKVYWTENLEKFSQQEYSVQVTDSIGCKSSSCEAVSVRSKTTSIEETKINEISIIECRNMITITNKKQVEIEIMIFTLDGKTLFNLKTNKQSFDIKNEWSQIVVVKLISNNYINNIKILNYEK